MSCKTEKNRSDDKFTDWRRAQRERNNATNLALIAAAAALVACPLFWTGFGTPACAAACVAFATSVANEKLAIEKEGIALDAYNKAFQDYQQCMSKCKRK